MLSNRLNVIGTVCIHSWYKSEMLLKMVCVCAPLKVQTHNSSFSLYLLELVQTSSPIVMCKLRFTKWKIVISLKIFLAAGHQTTKYIVIMKREASYKSGKFMNPGRSGARAGIGTLNNRAIFENFLYSVSYSRQTAQTGWASTVYYKILAPLGQGFLC